MQSTLLKGLLGLALLAGMSTLGHASSVKAAPASPDDTIRALYTADAPFISGKGESLLGNAKQMARFLSHSLDKALDKDAAEAAKLGQPPTIEGDPFIDAQEADATDISVSLIASDAATAKVKARFKRSDGLEEITYSMVMERGLWRIDDIAYKRADGSSDTIRGQLAGK